MHLTCDNLHTLIGVQLSRIFQNDTHPLDMSSEFSADPAPSPAGHFQSFLPLGLFHWRIFSASTIDERPLSDIIMDNLNLTLFIRFYQSIIICWYCVGAEYSVQRISVKLQRSGSFTVQFIDLISWQSPCFALRLIPLDVLHIIYIWKFHIFQNNEIYHNAYKNNLDVRKEAKGIHQSTSCVQHSETFFNSHFPSLPPSHRRRIGCTLQMHLADSRNNRRTNRGGESKGKRERMFPSGFLFFCSSLVFVSLRCAPERL